MKRVPKQQILNSLVVVLVALSEACTSSGSQSRSAQLQLEGRWEGQIEMLPVLKKRIMVRFIAEKDTVRGTIDVPTSLTAGVPLDDLTVSEVALRFSLPLGERAKLQFDGTIESDRIQGSVKGVAFPGTFLLKRVSKEVDASASPPTLPEWNRKSRDDWPTAEWKTSAPAAEGMDADRLAQAERAIGEKLPEVRSLLVVRNGKVVFEKYFRGPTAKDTFNIKSVTKSFTSALIGIALRQGLLRSLDEKIADLLPEYFTPQTDPRKRQITLRHVLTMTAGFEWRENGPITAEWLRSADYAKFTIDLPLVADPGNVHNYNTGLSHLLSVILTRQSKMSTLEFARKHLFGPLGIRAERWDTDPKGYHEGGSELYLTARDLARFGFLYLNAGRWEEKEIVPAEWVRESTRPHAAKDPLWADYGYLWWVGQDDDLPAFAALGYGGQMIYVVPSLDLVVVMTSTINNSRNDLMGLVRDFVVPAVKNK
jgi:CubicO group peptidase (beta-lactamase class C family)